MNEIDPPLVVPKDEFKTVPVRFERTMHRALVLYAIDNELTVTAVIRQAVAAKLAILLEQQPTVTSGDLKNGQSESKGKHPRKTKRTKA
jgi:hypothetical protein